MWHVIGISPQSLYFSCHVNTWFVGYVWWMQLKRRTVTAHAGFVKQSLDKWKLLVCIICDAPWGVAAEYLMTLKLYSQRTWMRGYVARRLCGKRQLRVYMATRLRSYVPTRLLNYTLLSLLCLLCSAYSALLCLLFLHRYLRYRSCVSTIWRNVWCGCLFCSKAYVEKTVHKHAYEDSILRSRTSRNYPFQPFAIDVNVKVETWRVF